MKRNNIRALAAVAFVLGGMFSASAQDVVTLHMKDGITHRYPNGDITKAHLAFWQFAPDADALPTQILGAADYTAELDVASIWQNSNRDYGVLVFWEENLTGNFPSCQHGLCFGMQPGLTTDNCEEMIIFDNNYTQPYSLREAGSSYHYIVIGCPPRGSLSFMRNEGGQQKPWTLNHFYGDDNMANRISTTLQPGQTYYYRTFAQGDVEQGGQVQQVTFYGEEKSFRIPRLMADAGFFEQVTATSEACSAFAASHFPVSASSTTWQELEPLWNLWRASTEGSQVDLSADISTEQFDDGTGYRLNRIPDAFYTWMADREVVIDAFEGLKEVYAVYDAHGELTPVATTEYVDNTAPEWNIPGNKYARLTPIIFAILPKVTYHSDEVVPGVHYQLQLNFAPETEYENTDSTKHFFLPSIIYASLDDHEAIFDDVPATEVTTVTLDGINVKKMGADIVLSSRASNAQVRRGTHNRIMRVAEMRLVPVKE